MMTEKNLIKLSISMTFYNLNVVRDFLSMVFNIQNAYSMVPGQIFQNVNVRKIQLTLALGSVKTEFLLLLLPLWRLRREKSNKNEEFLFLQPLSVRIQLYHLMPN